MLNEEMRTGELVDFVFYFVGPIRIVMNKILWLDGYKVSKKYFAWLIF